MLYCNSALKQPLRTKIQPRGNLLMKSSTSTSANCVTCIKCITQDINGHILCRDKGITSYNYSCRQYKLKPVLPLPNRRIMSQTFITCLQCRFFELMQSEKSKLGMCLYYKLRPFVGETRKACSKFQTEEDIHNNRLPAINSTTTYAKN